MKALLPIFLVICQVGFSQQNNCSFLLTDGIRNYIKTKAFEKDFDLVQSQIAKAYSSYKLDNSVANASARYARIFKGKAQYSRTEIEAIGEAALNRTLNVSEHVSWQNDYSEIIDPNWAKVVETCINANSAGVKYEIEQSDEGYLRDLNITVSYLGKDRNATPVITSIEADPDFLEVTGELKDAKEKKLDKSYTLKVKRKNMERTTPIVIAGQKILHPSVVFTIGVSNGENLQIVYPTIPYNEPIEVTYGVGEVVSSLLDVKTFLDIHNKNGQIWMLANGDPVNIGTAYRKYLDDNFPERQGICPDLRGVFLRGKNHNRESENGNPEEKKLGSFQRDKVIEHNHEVTKDRRVLEWYVEGTGRGTHAVNYASKVDKHLFGQTSTQYETKTFGGEETRPRNVTVNYFIRVN